MSSEVETSRGGSFAVVLRDSSRRGGQAVPALGMTKRLFAALEVYHDDLFQSAAMNMAIDEVLLEMVTVPSVRFYRWDHPALSFGYFGKFSDVEGHSDRDFVRRWTGGGIVFHGDDLTYSIVIPSSDPAFAESSMSIYERIHHALCNALITNRASVTVAALYERRNQPESAVVDRRYRNSCFANPVRADVMLNGRKVAGAAQRRTRRGLLHQGSIQLATGRVRPPGGHVDLENGLAARFARALSINCTERKIDGEILNRAGELAKQKYGTEAWLRRR